MIDKSNGGLKEILDHALKTNQERSIIKALAGVLNHERDGAHVVLYADFAKLSLAFSVIRDNKLIYNGGIIYHGKVGETIPENFSTTLTPTQGWAVHT